MLQGAKPTLRFEYGLSEVVMLTPTLSDRFLRKAVDYFRNRLAWELANRSLAADTLGEAGIENGAWSLAYALKDKIVMVVVLSHEISGEISNDLINELLPEVLDEFENKFFAADGEGVGGDQHRFDEWCGREPERENREISGKDAQDSDAREQMPLYRGPGMTR